VCGPSSADSPASDRNYVEVGAAQSGPCFPPGLKRYMRMSTGGQVKPAHRPCGPFVDAQTRAITGLGGHVSMLEGAYQFRFEIAIHDVTVDDDQPR